MAAHAYFLYNCIGTAASAMRAVIFPDPNWETNATQVKIHSHTHTHMHHKFQTY